jgi:hypothetical protein
MHSSLEWAISAAASVAIHFLSDGFSVEIYEADGSMRIGGSLGQHSSASGEVVINRLTDLRPRSTQSLHYAVESAGVDQPSQLVVAIMGRLTSEDANVLLRARRNRAHGLAMLLDVDSFAESAAEPGWKSQHKRAAELLRDNQWRVIEVTRGMGVPETWAALDRLGTAG